MYRIGSKYGTGILEIPPLPLGPQILPVLCQSNPPHTILTRSSRSHRCLPPPPPLLEPRWVHDRWLLRGEGEVALDPSLLSVSPKPVLRLRRLLHPRTSSGSIPRNQTERGHGPIIVLEMAWVRQNGESSLINSVISNQCPSLRPGGKRRWHSLSFLRTPYPLIKPSLCRRHAFSPIQVLGLFLCVSWTFHPGGNPGANPKSISHPQKTLRGGIRGSFLEPLARSWSHFVGTHCQKLTNSVQN